MVPPRASTTTVIAAAATILIATVAIPAVAVVAISAAASIATARLAVPPVTRRLLAIHRPEIPVELVGTVRTRREVAVLGGREIFRAVEVDDDAVGEPSPATQPRRRDRHLVADDGYPHHLGDDRRVGAPCPQLESRGVLPLHRSDVEVVVDAGAPDDLADDVGIPGLQRHLLQAQVHVVVEAGGGGPGEGRPVGSVDVEPGMPEPPWRTFDARVSSVLHVRLFALFLINKDQ